MLPTLIDGMGGMLIIKEKTARFYSFSYPYLRIRIIKTNQWWLNENFGDDV
jgi:hypothetical protein